MLITIKLLENTNSKMLNLELDKVFLAMTPKARDLKKKKTTVNLPHQDKNTFVLQMTSLIKWKHNSHKGREWFLNDVFNKELVSGIH